MRLLMPLMLSQRKRLHLEIDSLAFSAVGARKHSMRAAIEEPTIWITYGIVNVRRLSCKPSAKSSIEKQVPEKNKFGRTTNEPKSRSLAQRRV